MIKTKVDIVLERNYILLLVRQTIILNDKLKNKQRTANSGHILLPDSALQNLEPLI